MGLLFLTLIFKNMKTTINIGLGILAIISFVGMFIGIFTTPKLATGADADSVNQINSLILQINNSAVLGLLVIGCIFTIMFLVLNRIK